MRRSWVDQDGAQIVDVGQRRAGAQQVVERREEAGGIVVGEHGGGIEAFFARAGKRGRVDEGAAFYFTLPRVEKDGRDE